MFMLPPLTLKVATCSERHVQAVRCVDQQILQVGRVAAPSSGKRTTTLKCFSPSQISVAALPPSRGFDHVLDVGNVQAITGGALAVDLDHALRHFAGAVDEGRGDHARTPSRRCAAILPPSRAGRRVVAEHLDHDLAVDLRDAFQHVVADRLGEAGLDARECIAAPCPSLRSVVPW